MIKQLLAERSPRERLILAITAAFIGILMVYALFWQPLQKKGDVLAKGIARQQALKQWLLTTRQEVIRLRQQQSPANTTARDGRSLLAIVDQTARQAGLGGQLRRVAPNGKDGVRLRFEAVPFDQFIQWLEDILSSQNIAIESTSIDKRDETGLVDVSLNLRSQAGT